MGNYLVISADGHAGPPSDVYRDYLDPAFREAFDAHQAEVQAGRMVNTDFVAEWDEETGDAEMKAGYDPAVRDAVLDREGVAAEVLFPDADVLGTGRLASSPFGSGLGSAAGVDPAAVKAGARAHNRWLADFCATNADRRIGVAVVPITAGIDDAVAEVRAAAEAGLRGVLIPTRWFDAPAYLDPGYDPVWAACAETGLVLHTHSGAGPADYPLGPGFVSIYAAEAWWWAARPFWVLVLSGVFERHPGLRYSIAENGAWWVPDLVTRMDEKWEGGHNTRKFGDVFRVDLSMKPSGYVDRNCFFAASTPGADEIARRHQIGVDNLMWGNDLPHPEGTYPHTRRWIAERFGAVPPDETARILGGTAAAVYRVDTAALAATVDRIGPTTEEVHGA
ncbi:MAG TPA: amidohydrolase family protein [Acidimicrobiales bacterium]|nr:amidohydrolase family protein [Acidimicrobiales bacterium]